jgi:uncharacterized membrane protein YfcA
MLLPVLLFVLACVVGFFIGAVGVGGVLLIPPLAVVGGLSIHEASATALFTFLFTGLYGTWLFQQRGSIEWRVAAPVCAGSLLFAYIGAWLNASMGSRVLEAIIAGVVGLAGLYVFLGPLLHGESRPAPSQNRLVLLALGAVCGLGSGVSGAGGPLFSVPLMLLMGFAPLTAIGTGQVLQIASAGAGSIGNLQHGSIDFGYAVWLAIAELAGVYAGARLAHRVNAAILRRMVGALCLAAATFMLARLNS